MKRGKPYGFAQTKNQRELVFCYPKKLVLRAVPPGPPQEGFLRHAKLLRSLA